MKLMVAVEHCWSRRVGDNCRKTPMVFDFRGFPPRQIKVVLVAGLAIQRRRVAFVFSLFFLSPPFAPAYLLTTAREISDLQLLFVLV